MAATDREKNKLGFQVKTLTNNILPVYFNVQVLRHTGEDLRCRRPFIDLDGLRKVYLYLTLALRKHVTFSNAHLRLKHASFSVLLFLFFMHAFILLAFCKRNHSEEIVFKFLFVI